MSRGDAFHRVRGRCVAVLSGMRRGRCAACLERKDANEREIRVKKIHFRDQ
jgi:hypothetical protein